LVKDNKLRIVILYTGSTGFPLGDAYTNRILSIAKGLIMSGCEAELWIIYPGKKTGVLSKTGIIDSVPYRYLTVKQTSRKPIIKKLIGFYGVLVAVMKILFQTRQIDAIISFSESSLQNSPVGFFSRIRRILFIREINEYPKQVLKKGINGLTDNENSRIKKSLRYFTGLICISNSLKTYFEQFHQFSKPVLVVPITVDIDRFNNISGSVPENYITYCGNLFGDKDGVDILIKAFAKISRKYSNYKLQLIGNINDDMGFLQLKKFITETKLTDRIIFTGFIERNLLPPLLMNSAVLVLARPDNIQSRGGFPTKLGEYLATSRPVIVTAVGDIPDYIIDGFNGFLTQPGSIESFASRLSYVLANYDEASEVGKRGRQLAEKEFEAGVQAKCIHEFILGLKSMIN